MFNQGGAKVMQRVLFYEVAEEWLDIATIGVSFTWKKQLGSNVSHLNKHIGQKCITEITSFDIEAIIKKLYTYNPNTKKPASKRLLKAISQTASRIFEYAIEKNYITRNPAAKSSKKIPKDAPVQIIEALSEKQIEIVTKFECKTKIAAIIMAFLGLRTGELLALQWSDFDFDNGTVSINKRCSRISSNVFAVKNGTKNGKKRTLPIPSSIQGWLENQWLHSSTGLVFPNIDGKLHTPTTWRDCWTTYQNNLNYYVYSEWCYKKGINPKSKFSPNGIPDMNIRFNPHQLRHTFATMLYLSKVDVLTAKELMGHCDIETTLGIYTHLREKFKKLNILQFDEYIQKELLKVSSL